MASRAQMLESRLTPLHSFFLHWQIAFLSQKRARIIAVIPRRSSRTNGLENVCRRYTCPMSTRTLSRLTVAYLEAAPGELLDRQHDLGEYLRQAGNSEEQIKFWMGFCIELEGDEDGDLRSVVTTDAVLSALEGNLKL